MVKEKISEFLDEEIKNLHEYKKLDLSNHFTIIEKVDNIYFAYYVYNQFIFYRIIKEIQYYHIEKLLKIKDNLNTKGTKLYNRYHPAGNIYKKGNSQRIKSFYRRLHNLVFNRNY